MKILIVTADFHPTISPRSFRATELAKRFAKLGHDVSVLTPKQSGDSDFNEVPNIKFIDSGKNILDLNNCSTVARHLKRAVGKLLRMVRADYALDIPSSLFFFNIFFKMLSLRPVNMIVSIAHPHSVHWGVASALTIVPRKSNVWIADCGDPYSGNPFNKVPQYMQKFENFAFRRANAIAVPIEQAISAYSPDFRRKIVVIPQAFDIEKDRSHARQYVKNPIPTFGYAGNFYSGLRDPTALFEFLSGLSLDYRFHVFTANPDLYLPWSKKSVGKIVFHDRIPREKIIELFSTFDFLVNINNCGTVQAPSKLIDYKIIGRPVVSIDSSEVNAEVLTSYLYGDYSVKDSVMNIDISDYEISNVADMFIDIYQKTNRNENKD